MSNVFWISIAFTIGMFIISMIVNWLMWRAERKEREREKEVHRPKFVFSLKDEIIENHVCDTIMSPNNPYLIIYNNCQTSIDRYRLFYKIIYETETKSGEILFDKGQRPIKEGSPGEWMFKDIIHLFTEMYSPIQKIIWYFAFEDSRQKSYRYRAEFKPNPNNGAWDLTNEGYKTDTQEKIQDCDFEKWDIEEK